MLILLSACSNDNDQTEDPIEENDSGLSLRLESNGDFGKILVNKKNQSIYFFAGDVTGESNCNGGCADVWPALIGEVSELEISSDLDINDFSAITREGGQKQIAYKGWPLYYFSPDADGVLEAPGETLGDGQGGLFHVAKPDYSILLGQQAVTEGGDPVVYLVDYRGVSLYYNMDDDENKSNCAGGCAGVWPPFKTPENLVLPSSLSLDDFVSNKREDDLGPQLAYKKSPLYFFSQDEEKRGSVLGQAGGPSQTFFVVEPAK
ncbi:MAG: hypothetical protein WBG90_22145 [Saonia sp.]